MGSTLLQATAHGIAQGTLSLMQGADLSAAGMAAITGFVTSGVMSGVTSIAPSITKSLGASMITGGVVGGISSKLAGGNFWQGAAVGAIVAGLNHSLHASSQKAELKCVLEQDIIDADLDPTDKNVTGRSGELMEKVKSIKKLATAITSRKGTIKVTDVTELDAAGLTDQNDFSIKINVNSFNNNTLLGYAYTLGHELIHSFDWQFNMDNWKDDYGSGGSRGEDLHALRELRAYDWNKSMGMTPQGQQIPTYDGFKSILKNSTMYLQKS